MLQASAQGLTEVSSTQKHDLGALYSPDGVNVYMYGKGVASTAAGSWVSFDENANTALLVANAKGRVGVAMAALVASTYGWYQVFGKNIIAKALTGFADNGLIFETSTAGSVDDTAVAGDLVVGAMGRSALASGVITVELNYPFVTDNLGA